MNLTRRALIAGVATTAFAKDAPGQGDEFVVLDHRLHRLRHRCTTLEARVQRIADEAIRLCGRAGASGWDPEIDAARAGLGYDQVWQRWSDSVSRTQDLAEHILSLPAISLNHLVVKHRALIVQFELADQGDAASIDALRAFGRDLEALITR